METSGPGQQLMDVVLQFFQNDGWNYQIDPKQPVIRAGYRGDHGTWVCYARVDEESGRFTFRSLMGMNIAGYYRPAVMEYLTRVNARLPVGNFEMDLDTGNVSFKTSVETPNGELSLPMVRALAYTNVRAMDTYFPGVLAVIHSGFSPEAALARVEAQAEESPEA